MEIKKRGGHVAASKSRSRRVVLTGLIVSCLLGAILGVGMVSATAAQTTIETPDLVFWVESGPSSHETSRVSVTNLEQNAVSIRLISTDEEIYDRIVEPGETISVGIYSHNVTCAQGVSVYGISNIPDSLKVEIAYNAEWSGATFTTPVLPNERNIYLNAKSVGVFTSMTAYYNIPTPASTPTPEPPGFEAIFAIAGLLAVAYLVRRRKN